MGITVTKGDNNTFIVTRGTETIIFKDSNPNGIFDPKDQIEGPKTMILSADELKEAYGLSLGTKEDMTAQEMAEYEAFLKEREARQQMAELQANTEAPKNGFWNKLVKGCTQALPFLTAASGFMGVLSSFGFNNNAADNAIKWNTTMNTLSSATLTIGALGMMKNMTGDSTTVFSNPYGYGQFNFNGFNSTMDINGIMSNALKVQEQWTTAQNQQVAQWQNSQIKSIVEKLYETCIEDDSNFAEANKNFIIELYNEDIGDIDETHVYTQDEIAQINQIKLTPRIPIQHINMGTEEDSTKISKKFATKLEAILKKYDTALESQQEDIMTKAQYNSLKAALNKEVLTANDIKSLKNLYTEIIKTQKEKDDNEAQD